MSSLYSSIIPLRRRRIIIDVDTQRDLFLCEGKNCIRNHRRVLKNLRRFFAWARQNKIKCLSTALAFTESDNQHYCLNGTEGYRKVSYTKLSKRVIFPADKYSDLRKDIFSSNDQVILLKRSTNPFDEPRADRMLTELKADEFIVVGACVEDAILSTVLGLLQIGKKVTVVTDAVGYHNKDAADIAIRKMQIKGAKLIETKDIAGVGKMELVHACQCERCRGKMKGQQVKVGAA